MTTNDDISTGIGSLLDLRRKRNPGQSQAAQLLRIIEFARKRGLPTEGPDWLSVALLAAALDHPEIKIGRPRGRPKVKGTLSALLRDQRTPSEKKADALLRQIETQRAIMSKAGISAPKDVDVIRGLIALRTHPDHPNFKKEVAIMQSDLSRARKRGAGGRKLANKSA
ncbi:hypothetical protein ACLNGM_20205 [Aureimonas phyllosphaerae]|uniref:hypothetical protein n=1 Tax=Aureimonas phyllosphaerae TaxID=1166078 RepID=UPI003A5C3DD4